METIRLLLQVMDGGKNARNGRESGGRNSQEKKVLEAVDAHVKVDIEAATCFQLFDTSEKPNHFVASRRRWLESQGRDGARQENGQNKWHDLEYQGARAKAPPYPDRTLQTATASAKLVVSCRRRPSGLDGR